MKFFCNNLECEDLNRWVKDFYFILLNTNNLSWVKISHKDHSLKDDNLMKNFTIYLCIKVNKVFSLENLEDHWIVVNVCTKKVTNLILFEWYFRLKKVHFFDTFFDRILVSVNGDFFQNVINCHVVKNVVDLVNVECYVNLKDSNDYSDLDTEHLDDLLSSCVRPFLKCVNLVCVLVNSDDFWILYKNFQVEYSECVDLNLMFYEYVNLHTVFKCHEDFCENLYNFFFNFSLNWDVDYWVSSEYYHSIKDHHWRCLLNTVLVNWRIVNVKDLIHYKDFLLNFLTNCDVKDLTEVRIILWDQIWDQSTSVLYVVDEIVDFCFEIEWVVHNWVIVEHFWFF